MYWMTTIARQKDARSFDVSETFEDESAYLAVSTIWTDLARLTRLDKLVPAEPGETPLLGYNELLLAGELQIFVVRDLLDSHVASEGYIPCSGHGEALPERRPCSHPWYGSTG
jgi:hypothetical protein